MLNFFAHHVLLEGGFNLKDIRVMDEIGRGNSHVYTAFIKDQLYALKQMEIKTDYQYQNFLKQISYMKEISEISENMIKYYGYFVTIQDINQYSRRKYAHIIMECAEMNLQNLITCRADEAKRFSKQEIIKIIDFLLHSFAHLEKNKIAHCDIKPENILILSKSTLTMKLCDVGSCKIVDSQSVEQATVFGTVPFLAPELVKTKSNKIISSNVFKSDVFSFGLVVLYVILFKKFSSKERIEISEQAYGEVIAEWVRQAREIVGFDSRIVQVLRGALEFEEYKRPLFKDVCAIYQQEKKRKEMLYNTKLKKLEDEDNQRKLRIDRLQQNFASIPTKVSLFKTRNNLNTKISNRTASIGFPKISRNYQRNHVSPGQMSPGLSPLLTKRQSSCFSPEKINTSTLDFKKIIYVTEEDKQSIPFEFLTQEQKNFVFLTNGPVIKKSDCLSIYQPCSLSLLYELAQCESNKLFVEYEKFQGIGVGSDCPTLKAKKVYANFKQTQLVGGYKYIFKAACGPELQALEVDVTKSDISFGQINQMIQRFNGKSLKYLGIIWENYLMNPQQHSVLTQKIAKLSVKKFALVFNQNFIKYQKQARFQLPKNCETLYLEYNNNFMSKLISNLSISLLNSPIKQLYLSFSNNNLSKSEANMLFKSVSSIETLQKLIINLSWNPIEDISYMIQSLTNLKNVTSLEFKIYHSGVSMEQIMEALSEIKELFQKNLKIFKLGYDRNIRRDRFQDMLEQVLDGTKSLKIDVIGYDNKHFMAFIKKSSKGSKQKATTTKLKGEKTNLMGFKSLEQQSKKQGYCLALYSSNSNYDNYLCLACSQFSQLSKSQYFCKYCIENCRHKGHNIVKIYERTKCCCSYSGCCTTEIAKRICAQQLKIKKKKKYICLKCSRQMCLSCIGRCLDNHKEWIEQSKELVVFQCGGYV